MPRSRARTEPRTTTTAEPPVKLQSLKLSPYMFSRRNLVRSDPVLSIIFEGACGDAKIDMGIEYGI
jgi:hypothetical protein